MAENPRLEFKMTDQNPGDRCLKEAAEARQLATKQTAGEWLAENMTAIETHNAWMEANGLVLAEYRQF